MKTVDKPEDETALAIARREKIRKLYKLPPMTTGEELTKLRKPEGETDGTV